MHMNIRHMNRKHSNFAPVIPMSQEKCQRFQFEHPFTCMVAGMTGSGKTVWVQSLLTQAYRMINLPPEKIVWCYSQWQPAYMEMLVTIPNIEFVEGIPTALEQDAYFSVNKRNWCGQRSEDRQLVYKRIPPSQPECHLHRTERIPSRKRQSQH